jgi:hypothetical protein
MSTISDSTESGCSLASGRILNLLTISIQETFHLMPAIVHKCHCVVEFHQNVIAYDMRDWRETKKLIVYKEYL